MKKGLTLFAALLALIGCTSQKSLRQEMEQKHRNVW